MTIKCNKCWHGINIHNAIEGCQHVDTVNNYDSVCPCWQTPEDISRMQMKEERTQAYKDLLLEIDASVYPEVYGYIEDKILALKGFQ